MNFLNPSNFVELQSDFQEIFNKYSITEVLVKEMGHGRGFSLYVQSTSPESENLTEIQEACSNLLFEHGFYAVEVLSLNLVKQRVHPKDAIPYNEFINRHTIAQPTTEMGNAGEPGFAFERNAGEPIPLTIDDLPNDLLKQILDFGINYRNFEIQSQRFKVLTKEHSEEKPNSFIIKKYGLDSKAQDILKKATQLFKTSFQWEKLNHFLFSKTKSTSLRPRAELLHILISQAAQTCVKQLLNRYSENNRNFFHLVYNLYSCLLTERYLHSNALDHDINSNDYNLLHCFAILPLTSTPSHHIGVDYILEKGGPAAKRLIESAGPFGVTPLNAACVAQRVSVVRKLLQVIQSEKIVLPGASPYLHAIMGYEIPLNNSLTGQFNVQNKPYETDIDRKEREFKEIFDYVASEQGTQHPNSSNFNEHCVINILNEFNYPNALTNEIELAQEFFRHLELRHTVPDDTIRSILEDKISDYISHPITKKFKANQNASKEDYAKYAQENQSQLANEFKNMDALITPEDETYDDNKMQHWFKAIYHLNLAIKYHIAAGDTSNALRLTCSTLLKLNDQQLALEATDRFFTTFDFAQYVISHYSVDSDSKKVEDLQDAVNICSILETLCNQPMDIEDDWKVIYKCLAKKYADFAKALVEQIPLENDNMDSDSINTSASQYSPLFQSASTTLLSKAEIQNIFDSISLNFKI